jgi:PAS domain S-box-containing protein
MQVGFGDLTLESQGTEFFARIPVSSEDILALRIGDQVRVTGAPLVAAHGSAASHVGSRVTLYSASPADVEFLGAAAQSNSYITTGILAVLTILGAVMVWNWSLRRQVQSRTTQLNEASTHLRTAFEAVREGVLVNDRNCRVTGFNREFVRLFGFQPIEGQMVTAALRTIELQLVDRHVFASLQHSAFEKGDRSVTAVLELRSPGLTLHAFSSPIVDADGISHGNLWTFEDVTEKLRFESELLQAQKMDAIGQLSGGIAHDFNNLLTIIRSSITLIDLSISSGQSWHEYTNAAETAVDRAAELTQHLLDFSRKSRLDLRLIEVNPFIERVCMLVRRSMDCTVELNVRLLDEPANITVDVTRLEQVLINLCINARDALPEKGGEIRLELSKRSNHRLGNVVVIAVEDNGIGMSAELCQRIFEPFFTTKKPGHGTGLGLAMAHGVVEQLGGSIACDSEPGRGTRFEIVLPASDASIVTNVAETLPVRSDSSPLRVLLVDDEVLVRESGQAILESLGHSTLTAANGREALDMLLSGCEFDLIMLDLTMPEMSGKETFFEIRSRWPSLPVAICSGYSLDTQLWLTDDMENPPTVIPKPYRRKDLGLHLQSLQKALASQQEPVSQKALAASEYAP